MISEGWYRSARLPGDVLLGDPTPTSPPPCPNTSWRRHLLKNHVVIVGTVEAVSPALPAGWGHQKLRVLSLTTTTTTTTTATTTTATTAAATAATAATATAAARSWNRRRGQKNVVKIVNQFLRSVVVVEGPLACERDQSSLVLLMLLEKKLHDSWIGWERVLVRHRPQAGAPGSITAETKLQTSQLAPRQWCSRIVERVQSLGLLYKN